MQVIRRLRHALVVALILASATRAQEASPRHDAAIRAYIHRAWDDLTRSNRDILRAAADPKLGLPEGAPWPVYVSRHEDRGRIARELAADLGPAPFREIDLRRLPERPLEMREHGLLYLPWPYVVPGGRFNEMYGWDSFFIQLGLLRDGEHGRARDMVANFLYEVEQYGKVLNANRTYYLTRSQPPFLGRMILALYELDHDREALRRAVPSVEACYRYWTTGDHRAGDTGLSRYHDAGRGPAPEVVAGERDAAGRTHYDRAREYYRTHEVRGYDVSRVYDRKHDRLKDLFYEGDRAMRESGFDPSNRFGPFSVAIVDHAPVCLNSLLYQLEMDLARIEDELGEPAAAERYRSRAAERRRAIDRRLWDDATGLYLDYDYKADRRRDYVFATTFYPLWVGLASPAQARRVRDEGLRRLEAPHGLLTSTQVTGSQWDAPFGWAPLQWIAIQGLRRYGYHEDADRLARKFMDMVRADFEAHGVIVEKYDVTTGRSDVAPGLRFGYGSNEVGFGWTNGVFLDLADTTATE
jgi:alpha,alpha-trehalase